MRCLYSVPVHAATDVSTCSRDYASALARWTPDAISKGDRLTALVERLNGARICLEDPDWDTLRGRLSEGNENTPVSDIFWAPIEVSRVANAILALELAEGSPAKTLEAWLRTEADRDRSVLVLAR